MAIKNARPLSWHKECLANQQASLLRQLEVVQRANADADRLRRDIVTYDAQIIEAEMRGFSEFDRDKFGKKRSGGGSKEEST